MRLTRTRAVPLLASSLLLTLLAVAAPGAPPAGAVASRPRAIVSAIGATPVAQPAHDELRRSDTQSVSGDGRYIAFTTLAGDANGDEDVYLRDRRTGTTEIVSLTSSGALGNRGSYAPSISSDGRYVAFVSAASNMTAVDDFLFDVYVRDRVRGTTTRVSRHSDGTSTGDVWTAQISANGKAIVWQTTTGAYVRQLPGGTISNPAGGSFLETSLSGDGRFLAYVDLFGDGVVRRIRISDGAVWNVSVTPGGAARTGEAPNISYDGRQVAFSSTATDIDPEATTGGVFVRSVDAGTTEWWVGAADLTSLVLSGNAEVATFTTSVALTADDTDSSIDVYAAYGPGEYALLSAELPPAIRGGRPPWYAELSGDGRIATLVSAAVVPGSGTGGGLRRWAVATEHVDRDLTGSTDLLRIGYHRLFHRAPTDAELDTREAQVSSAGRTTPEVLLDDLRRDSFSGSRAGVVRLYRAYFRRDPDTAGYDYWVAQRRSGRSLDSISQAFSGTPEFRTLYGPLTNRQFVNLVYTNVLGRPADTAGSSYWTAQLDSGARNRGQVMTGFSESPENKDRTRNRVEVIMYVRSFDSAVPSAWSLDQLEAAWAVGIPLTDTIDGLWV